MPEPAESAGGGVPLASSPRRALGALEDRTPATPSSPPAAKPGWLWSKIITGARMPMVITGQESHSRRRSRHDQNDWHEHGATSVKIGHSTKRRAPRA